MDNALNFGAKKVLEIKSYHLETFFSRSFFWFQHNFIQNVCGKKFSNSEKCMVTKDVYNHGKKEIFNIKYTPGCLY